MKKIIASILIASALAGCDAMKKINIGGGAQLRIETTPAGATIFVNGTARGTAPGTLPDLHPGSYLVIARKDGYKESRASITIAASEHRTLALELKEMTGLVLVHTTPPDADVNVDGAFRGKTPLLLPTFPYGPHRVAITRPGYFKKDVDVTAKDRVPQYINVELVADSAALSVDSQPQGATVLVNGSNRGTSPCKIDQLPSGEVEVELKLDGYAPFHQTLKLAAGQSYTVNAPLAAQPGDLQVITTPPKAKVYLDNQYSGESPVKLPGIAAGSHRVRVELRGYGTDARDVTVKAGDSTTEEFRLEQNSGKLVLITEPGGARVLVDGEEQGQTKAATVGYVSDPLEINLLAPGEHTLQLVAPGWTYTATKFTVEAGKAASLHEKMTRLFIPDIEVRTADETITGVLLKDFAGGDVEIESSPGVIRHVKAIDIVERKSIKQKN